MIICTFEKGYEACLRHVVVHSIVEKDGRVLLAKRAGNILETGKWALPGGFLNRDENGAKAALRELQEETGWQGEIIGVFRINSSPNRPGEDRQNVVIEYLVKPVKKIGEHDNEASTIEWFSLEKLPPPESVAFDHFESLELYRKYKETPFSIPIVV